MPEQIPSAVENILNILSKSLEPYNNPEFIKSLKETELPKEKENISCFFALIDILGFKEWLSDKFEQKFDEYIGAIELSIKGKDNINFQIFSDTIIIYSSKAEEKELNDLVMICSSLLYNLIKIGIPVRGCITNGQLTRFKPKKDIFKNVHFLIGKPIIDAYKYGQDLDFIGITISPACMEFIHSQGYSGIHPYSQVLYHYENIPIKKKNSGIKFECQGMTIIPCISDDNEQIPWLKAIISKLEILALFCPDQFAQIKYQNTIKWLKCRIEAEEKWDRSKKDNKKSKLP
jgi:hypothetical protein